MRPFRIGPCAFAMLLASALLLGGCSHAASPGATPAEPAEKATAAAGDGAAGRVDYSCQTDAQCAVKNVGNCCGYYPACVNADSPTFPERVQAECAREGMSSVCGFKQPASCQCVEGRCEPGPDLGAVR